MTLPIPNLDDKTFEQLVEEAKKLIPVYAPDWTDHNLHDPGITLIELFAWLTEMQLYSLNRITESNYVKYLKLLGESPLGVEPATVDITIADWPDGIKSLDKGSRFIAKNESSGNSIIFETDTELKLSRAKLEKIIVYSGYEHRDMSQFNKSNKNFFYAFGENPKTDDALYLGFSYPNEVESLTLTFYLYEDDLPETGKHGDNKNSSINKFFPPASVKWSYYSNDTKDPWKETKIKDGTVQFTQSGKIKFDNLNDLNTNAPAKLQNIINTNDYIWIKCEIMEGSYELPPRIERILINTVPATQCEFIEPYTLGKSTGLPDQIFSLDTKKMIQKNSVMIKINNKKWKETDDILIAEPDENYFQVDYTENKIIFGNDLNGRIPPADSEIIISYKHSDGESGNIRAGAINANHAGVEATNYFPARNGKHPESLTDAIIRLKKDMLVPYMAVTLNDYERIARMTPNLRVARAKAIADKTNNSVRIIVVPYSFSNTPLPTQKFRDTVYAHLDRHISITTDINVDEPRYIKVSVHASIVLVDKVSPDTITKSCIAELKKFLSPIKRNEGDKEWEFGRDVYKSDIYALLENIDGVDGVVNLKLIPDKAPLDTEGNVSLGDEYLVYSGEHQIEIVSKSIC